MSVNAREETYEHVELFGKPALFTNARIERSTVPNGWYCYDMRGSGSDPGKPSTIEDHVAVNHAATILSPTPLKKPEDPFRQIRGKLNFLGEDVSLAEFCISHNIDYPTDNPKFTLRPASPDEAELFYTATPERDSELGTIGHVRIDFGKSGSEFWHTWWARGNEALCTSEFKAELDELINELRASGPLRDLSTMSKYCTEHGSIIENGSFGYVAETGNYRYCLRCCPNQGDYNAYLTAYDLRMQRMDIDPSLSM